MADDVFSNAILAAYQNQHKFQPGSNFRAWMYRIITNKCFVSNREISRRGSELDEFSEGLGSLAADPHYRQSYTSADTFLEECGDEVTAAMRKLSSMERSCLMLKTMENFSYKEIAQILEIPFGTVMTHLSRGRAKLRKELMNYAQQNGIANKVLSKPKLMPKKDNNKIGVAQ